MPLAYSGSPLCTLENSLMVGVGERRERKYPYASVRVRDGRHESAHMSGMSFPPNAHSMCVSIHLIYPGLIHIHLIMFCVLL